VECRVKWVGTEGMSFVAETGAGTRSSWTVARKAAAATSGRGRWKQSLLAPAAAPPYDVVVILKKSKQQVTGCDVQLRAEARRIRSQGVYVHTHALSSSAGAT